MTRKLKIVHVRPKKGFNDNDAKYLCCRNKYHLRKGAIIVAGIELVAIGLAISYCVVAYFMDGFYKMPKGTEPRTRRSLLILALAMSVIAGVSWSITISLLVWGVKRSRPALLMPHMMMQTVAIVSLGGLTALFVWWAVEVNKSVDQPISKKSPFGGWDQDFRADRNNVVIVTALFSTLSSATILALFTEIFFFFVVRGCHKYLRAKINYQLKQQKKLPES